MTNFAVQLCDITKTFPAGRSGRNDVAAVNHINLSIQPGEFFTLLGPSGCGKTTTLRLIAGFEQPTQGEIFIQNQPVSKIPPYHRPVNTVFQNYALFPHLTVGQNVAFGLNVKGVPRHEIEQRVKESLDLVRLPDLENRKPSQLSGGQQQRVALARAIVNRPSVLLLDEPLGALDLKLRKAMQLELKHLQTQLGMTFIYVTHDQEEALTMSDRIAVMNEGLVLQIDDPVTIYEKPATRFVADFIGESNFLNGNIDAVLSDKIQVNVAGTQVFSYWTNNGLKRGQDVTLTVRPEKLKLAPLNGTNHGTLIGTVQEIVYLGTDTRYLVGLLSQETVVIRVQNVGGDRSVAFAIGDQVKVSWFPEDIRTLIV